MPSKFLNVWASCIVKTNGSELLLADKQKRILLENFGQNKTTANWVDGPEPLATNASLTHCTLREIVQFKIF